MILGANTPDITVQLHSHLHATIISTPMRAHVKLLANSPLMRLLLLLFCALCADVGGSSISMLSARKRAASPSLRRSLPVLAAGPSVTKNFTPISATAVTPASSSIVARQSSTAMSFAMTRQLSKQPATEARPSTVPTQRRSLGTHGSTYLVRMLLRAGADVSTSM